MSYNKPTRVTAQIVDRNIQAARDNEVLRRNYQHFADEGSKLLYTANAQVKVESRRRQTYANSCLAEQNYEQKTAQDDYNRSMDRLEKDQNQKIAETLDREISDRERHAREIQRICEDAPELRDLERALKLAYMNKDRAAQNEEKIFLQQNEQARLQAMEVWDEVISILF